MTTLKAVRGTRDLLPPETALWNRIEATARAVFARYNFGEIRTPIFEDTIAVCARRGRGDRHCLQGDVHVGGSGPGAVGEGAVADAAAGEYGRRGSRLYRAQAGRERASCRSSTTSGRSSGASGRRRGATGSFAQIGAEVIGPPSAGSERPLRDAEVLEMLATLLDELGITGWTLEINSVGSAADRARYNETLRAAWFRSWRRRCARIASGAR